MRVPSLAERREDVVQLAVFFCEEVCQRHRFPRVTLSNSALRAAQTADWPGNVRQLAHAIEAAAIRAVGEAAAQVELAHLFPDKPVGVSPATSDSISGQGLTFQEATRRCQIRILRESLEASDWNVSEVARRLDLARSHVYTLIQAFGLERKSA